MGPGKFSNAKKVSKGKKEDGGPRGFSHACHEYHKLTGAGKELPADFAVGIGKPLPFGASEVEGGINFAVFSRHAQKVWLELFDAPEDEKAFASIELDPKGHRTGDIWHVWIRGIGNGQIYAFRVDGPYQPEEGHRFNRHKLLLDPYAHALVGTRNWDFKLAIGAQLYAAELDIFCSTENNARHMAKCLLADTRFDWQGDRPLKHSWSDTILYETHVRGLTIHPSSAAKNPGTFLGIVEKIPYFKKLGITAIELMPVQEFNENELDRLNPITGERLRNFWGYNTVSFFAPKESYSSGRELGCQVTEFKTMVRELHRAGIEVILDIVLNHTAEGDERGPTLNFRGMENSIYYMLRSNRRLYRNYSGCGNSLNCNHPVVRGYILDCLRHWVIEMHVDGFRFDLATVLGRDLNGDILPNPPILERIAEDPLLRDVKLIAEAWDAGGAYQVGSFPGQRWSEWNGHYRDDVRRFWRGDPGMIGALASRICGSADLYQRTGKHPLNSINFITCHDGFTLNDLVSYKLKHNEANGEENLDGEDENFSDNYGVEGETTDPAIESLRIRQIKNMLATLFISRGVPMILGGDEFRRTQKGNNNAYCQDNEVSWFDWTLLSRNRQIFRFTREMIHFRKRHKVLAAEKFYTADDIVWFGPDGKVPEWEGDGRTLGCMVNPMKGEADESKQALCILFNAEETAKVFTLPSPPPGRFWHRFVDTSKSYPHDIRTVGKEKIMKEQGIYPLQARSMVILIAE
ncbi:glycogen debranching protein GlgX [Desulforhabdus amnigena]|jgi:glycogen operon protein|nr:glycogen debranching protein GlgX [Desulforhabdus amnigena]NLJ28073.1 glycogen debranching protein GlgX [Deltaproteobacteria bacterium]